MSASTHPTDQPPSNDDRRPTMFNIKAYPIHDDDRIVAKAKYEYKI